MPQSTFISTVKTLYEHNLQNSKKSARAQLFNLPCKEIMVSSLPLPSGLVGKELTKAETIRRRAFKRQRRAGRQQSQCPSRRRGGSIENLLPEALWKGSRQRRRQWWLSCRKSAAQGAAVWGTQVVRFTVPWCELALQGDTKPLKLFWRSPCQALPGKMDTGEMKSTDLSLFVPDTHLWENHQFSAWKKLPKRHFNHLPLELLKIKTWWPSLACQAKGDGERGDTKSAGPGNPGLERFNCQDCLWEREIKPDQSPEERVEQEWCLGAVAIHG